MPCLLCHGLLHSFQAVNGAAAAAALVTFSTKGFCPNFITKATKLQGSNNTDKEKKQHT
jgi:hypothetical protein